MARWKTDRTRFLMILSAAALFVVASCSSEDDPNGPVTGDEVDVLTIICNPLAPAPGEQAQLTVQATGQASGTWPTYNWTAEAGSLIVAEGLSIGWIAPDDPGIYNVRVVANLAGQTDTVSRKIMVRHFEPVDFDFTSGGRTYVVSEAYAPTIVSTGLTCIATGENWYGTLISSWLYTGLVKGTSAVTAKTGFADNFGGDFIEFYGNPRNQILTSMMVSSSGYFRQQRKDVILYPLLSFGSTVNLSYSDVSDEPMSGAPRSRRNIHQYPSASADFSMVTWQEGQVGLAQDGTEDLFNIAFSNASMWNQAWSYPDGSTDPPPPLFMTLTTSLDSATAILGPDTVTVYNFFHNINPLFTPDDANILYFVDSTGIYEPCIIPMAGNEPDTTLRRAMMIDDDHGIFWQAGISVREKTIFQWNPSNNLLGFIDGYNHLCFFDYATESVQIVDQVGSVSEFAWSPDGTQAAVVGDDGVYIVNLSGMASRVFRVEIPGDAVYGVSWSMDPASPRLVFRVTRKGKTEIDSFSSIVVYDYDADEWYYAAPRISYFREPEIDDYRWLRVTFDADDDGIYAPLPVGDVPGRYVIIYHSFAE